MDKAKILQPQVKVYIYRMYATPARPYLLYADDDPDDQEILCEVIAAIKPGFAVIPVENGLEMMNFLQQIDNSSPLPCAIVLDINMPVKDGISTLLEIKQSERFSKIPVYMYTNSANPRDKINTLQLGAQAFYTKPALRQQLITISKEFIQSC